MPDKVIIIFILPVCNNVLVIWLKLHSDSIMPLKEVSINPKMAREFLQKANFNVTIVVFGI